MKLSVPYVKGISKILSKYTDSIDDVYYSDGVLSSGRNTAQIGYDLDIEIKKIRKMGIKVNYLVNSLLINKPTEKTLFTLKESPTYTHLNKIKDNFDIITINNLMYFFDNNIKSILDTKLLKNSVNNGIDSLYKLDELFKLAKFDYVNLDRRVNRNNNLVNKLCSDINKRGSKSVILVNEGCHFDCIFKEFCDLTFADMNQTTKFNCSEYYNDDKPESYLKTPILFHQNLKHINADIFKISGRTSNVEIIEKRIRHYLYGENILMTALIDKSIGPNNLMFDLSTDTLNKYNMIERLSDCHNNCHNCTLCNEVNNIK